MNKTHLLLFRIHFILESQLAVAIIYVRISFS